VIVQPPIDVLSLGVQLISSGKFSLGRLHSIQFSLEHVLLVKAAGEVIFAVVAVLAGHVGGLVVQIQRHFGFLTSTFFKYLAQMF
jgi:hypothetical protein